jgi:hypothetical protein
MFLVLRKVCVNSRKNGIGVFLPLEAPEILDSVVWDPIWYKTVNEPEIQVILSTL